jgi:hypothetical protein
VPHLRQGENALITRNVVLNLPALDPAEKIAFADADTFEFTMDLQKP